MFGFLKKKEPKKEWLDFKEMDKCNECSYLQEEYGFDGICPKCGSRDISRVVARWLISWKHDGLMCFRVNHKSEIRT